MLTMSKTKSAAYRRMMNYGMWSTRHSGQLSIYGKKTRPVIGEPGQWFIGFYKPTKRRTRVRFFIQHPMREANDILDVAGYTTMLRQHGQIFPEYLDIIEIWE